MTANLEGRCGPLLYNRVKYVNSEGTELILDDWERYLINTDALRSFSWDYTVANRPSGYGGKVTRFTRPAFEKSVRIGVRGNTEAEFADRIERLHALTEVDMLANTPGKLWLNNQYINCYLGIASDLNVWSKRGHFAEKEVKVLITEPFWCREVTQAFTVAAGTASTDGKKYTGIYPYRYGTTFSGSTINNTHYTSCPAIITFASAGDQPSVHIAGHGYTVDTTVGTGESVVIDQVQRTILHYNIAGVATNVFQYRDKTSDIFQYIPTGTSAVLYNADFSITLIQQRSEPTWN
jgi:hypothetical protein